MENHNTYEVVLTGAVKTGVVRANAVEKLSEVFKIPPEKAELLLQGRQTTIKRHLSVSSAERYRQVLNRIGVGFVIRQEMSPLSLTPIDTPSEIAPASSLPSPIAVCPNCGYQAISPQDPLLTKYSGQGECPNCGVIPKKCPPPVVKVLRRIETSVEEVEHGSKIEKEAEVSMNCRILGFLAAAGSAISALLGIALVLSMFGSFINSLPHVVFMTFVLWPIIFAAIGAWKAGYSVAIEKCSPSKTAQGSQLLQKNLNPMANVDLPRNSDPIRSEWLNTVVVGLNWVFGTLFILVGLIGMPNDIPAGLIFVSAGLILFPPARRLAYGLINWEIPATYRTLILVLLFVLFGFVAKNTSGPPTLQEASEAVANFKTKAGIGNGPTLVDDASNATLNALGITQLGVMQDVLCTGLDVTHSEIVELKPVRDHEYGAFQGDSKHQATLNEEGICRGKAAKFRLSRDFLLVKNGIKGLPKDSSGKWSAWPLEYQYDEKALSELKSSNGKLSIVYENVAWTLILMSTAKLENNRQGVPVHIRNEEHYRFESLK